MLHRHAHHPLTTTIGGNTIMNITVFFILLSAFAALSGLVTEGVKNLISDKANFSYNLLALIAALIVGSAGTAVYYRLTGVSFTADHVIHMILMGLASGLTSMVGFDKVKQTVEQLTTKKG